MWRSLPRSRLLATLVLRRVQLLTPGCAWWSESTPRTSLDDRRRALCQKTLSQGRACSPRFALETSMSASITTLSIYDPFGRIF